MHEHMHTHTHIILLPSVEIREGIISSRIFPQAQSLKDVTITLDRVGFSSSVECK